VSTSKRNWAEHFQEHSKLGIEFGMPSTLPPACPRTLARLPNLRAPRAATFGTDMGSDFESPFTQSLVPDPRIVMPPAINPPPDYDVFGGEAGFGKFGRGRARSKFEAQGASNFGIGTVIPSTYKPPPANPPPPPPDASDAGFGFGDDAEAPKPKSGILKTILAGIGLFVVGIFVDAAIERRVGPHHKSIVLFHK
jgi:hypothetical protein